MEFGELELPGVFVIRCDQVNDARGSFVRTFCAREFAQRGLVDKFVQHATSHSSLRGTIRGIHFQAEPFSETKVVRCIRGAIFDVILDLRRNLPSFGQWCATELSETEPNALYIPKGCAHAFQTLEDDCAIEYMITPEYRASAQLGIRWDDPEVGIAWPIRANIIMSERDRNLPLMRAAGA